MTDSINRVCHALLVLLPAFLSGCGGGVDDLSAWPQWQRLESNLLPSAWRVEEASVAFDAWEALVVVTHLATSDEATVIRFDDGAGDTLAVRMPAMPSRLPAPELTAGDTVRLTLNHRQGFEGVAQGLTILDQAGRLLLLYDDGGYGPAFYDDAARAGLSVERTPARRGAADSWAIHEVKFQLDGHDVVLREGESGRLGESGLVVTVVVAREWTGPPMTDVDLTPLAYVLYRAVGG